MPRHGFFKPARQTRRQTTTRSEVEVEDGTRDATGRDGTRGGFDGEERRPDGRDVVVEERG